MAHYSRNEQDDNHSRQQPNRADNDVARQGQVNSAHGENCGYRLSPWLWFVNVLWHLFFPHKRNSQSDQYLCRSSSELRHACFIWAVSNVISLVFVRHNARELRACNLLVPGSRAELNWRMPMHWNSSLVHSPNKPWLPA